MKRLFIILAACYFTLVVLANWLASRYTITIPFTAYVAPAGTLCIGGVLVVRDWIQQIRGLWHSLILVYVAGVFSYLCGIAFGWTSLQKIAVASLVAFTLSETIEALVFTPLRKRNLTAGVAISSTVGNALDSYVFLMIAFGSTAFFAGAFWGKMEMIALGTALTFGRRRLFPGIA